MPTYTIDTQKTADLAEHFAKDLRELVAELMANPVAWPKQAQGFMAQADPAAFLSWCWEKRCVLVADALRRVDRHYAKHTPADEILPAIEARSEARREARVEGARKRAAEGLLTGRWNVPGVGQVQLGAMTKENLLAVAGDFRAQAGQLVRRAKFFERLAKDLRPGETVADRFTADQVERWWRATP